MSPGGRSHVLAHLDDLVIKATYREFAIARCSVPHPHAYAGQALLRPSSTPPLVDSRKFDPDRLGNVAHALSAALQAAQSVRDRLDGDAWRMIRVLGRRQHHRVRSSTATTGSQ